MLVGITLTILLVVLSVARISPSGIAFRSPQLWSNQATIVLTQEGAPELRSVLPTSAAGGTSALADTSRFAGLIDVYTTLATSDPVIRVLERRGLIDPQLLASGQTPITAVPVVSTVGGGTTPMMMLSATAPTSGKATELTRAATAAFLAEVRSRQLAAKIPAKDRIQLQVVKAADEPKLVKPRSKALPMLVLLGGLIATMAVAFTRENVARRSTVPVLSAAPSEESVDDRPDTGAPHTRSSTLGPVPRRETATSREDASPATSSTRGRSTLGSVPDRDSASREPAPHDVGQEAPPLRQAGSSGRAQS